MKVIYSYLNGGLGNQMFQYAVARAISSRLDAELVVDSWSGFVRDYQYRRVFELSKLPIKARIATPIERVPIWLYRIQNRILTQQENLIQERFYGNFLVETAAKFLPDIFEYKKSSSTWLIGYWQSPKYFENIATELRSELTPTLPIQENFLRMGMDIKKSNSVALGIRLYEESANPGAHARDGDLKTVEDFNRAISIHLEENPRSQFFVFCTHHAPILKKLNLPNTTIYITHDNGYVGSLERLWLLTQCRHHIFSNSSYYWWGAWLSKANYNGQQQSIFSANNFINQDSLSCGWNEF